MTEKYFLYICGAKNKRMDDLEKEIEALITSKKNAEELPKKIRLSKKETILDSIELIIANTEKSAKKAKERKNKDFSKEDKNILLKTSEENSISKTEKPIKGEEEENHSIIFDMEIEKTNDSDKFISKRDIVGHLRLAKTGHKSWMANVQILIRSGNVDEAESLIPVNFTSCKFGKWYYGDGQMLSLIEEYQNLEKPHQMIHDVYLQIFNLHKTKIVGSLFNSEKKQIKERERKAASLKRSLISFSDVLFKNLLLLEDKVKKFTDEEINSLNAF